MSKIEKKSFHEERFFRDKDFKKKEWTLEKARDLDETLYKIEKAVWFAIENHNKTNEKLIKGRVEEHKEYPGFTLSWRSEALERQIAVYVKYALLEGVPLGICINRYAWKFDIDGEDNRVFRSTPVELSESPSLGISVSEYRLRKVIDHAILETSKIRAVDLTRVIQLDVRSS